MCEHGSRFPLWGMSSWIHWQTTGGCWCSLCTKAQAGTSLMTWGPFAWFVSEFPNALNFMQSEASSCSIIPSTTVCRSYVVKQSLGSSKNYHWYFDAQPMIKRLKGHLSPNSYIFFRCVMISMSVKDQITEDAPLTPSVWILWWELTFSQCISVMQSAIVSKKRKTK